MDGRSYGAEQSLLQRRLNSLLEFAAVTGDRVAVVHFKVSAANRHRDSAPALVTSYADALEARLPPLLPMLSASGRVSADAVAVAVTLAGASEIIEFVSGLFGSIDTPHADLGPSSEIVVSGGLSVAPLDGVRAERLLHRAALAATLAFDNDVQWERADGIPSLRSAEQELREAFAAGRIDVQYASVVSAETGCLAGYAASLRWHTADGEIRRQPDIDRIAEAGDLAEALLAHLLQTALRDAATWPSSLHLAIPLSQAQLSIPAMIAITRRALEESGLPAKRLLIAAGGAADEGSDPSPLHVLEQLRALGIQAEARSGTAEDTFSVAAAPTPAEPLPALRERWSPQVEALLRLAATVTDAPMAAMVAEIGGELRAAKVQTSAGVIEPWGADARAIRSLQGGADLVCIRPRWELLDRARSELLRAAGLEGCGVYAGVAIRDSAGLGVGVLCLVHSDPGALRADGLPSLQTIARAAADALQVALGPRPAANRPAAMPSSSLMGDEAFSSAVARAIAHRRRSGHTFSLLRISLALPAGNLAVGHATGTTRDLDVVAETIVACLREEDVPARLAEGDFAALLVAGDGAEAALVADRVSRAVRAQLARHVPGGEVTVAGVFFIAAPRDPADALRIVDEVLATTRIGGVLAATFAGNPTVVPGTSRVTPAEALPAEPNPDTRTGRGE